MHQFDLFFFFFLNLKLQKSIFTIFDYKKFLNFYFMQKILLVQNRVDQLRINEPIC